MKLSILSFAVVLVPTLVACGSKKEGGGASGGGDKPAALKLPKLGLTIDAPAESTVGDAIIGEGHMITAPGVGAISITTEKPQTLDEAKEDAKLFTPKNLKGETLPDGWVLTYDNTGSMGANFFVEVRRKIDGKDLKCGTTTNAAEQAAAAVAACKSLRK